MVKLTSCTRFCSLEIFRGLLDTTPASVELFKSAEKEDSSLLDTKSENLGLFLLAGKVVSGVKARGCGNESEELAPKSTVSIKTYFEGSDVRPT